MHIDVKSNFFNSPQDTLFKLLHNAGYKTGIFGKLTNQDGDYFCDNSNNKYNLTEAGMSRVFSMCNQQLYYDNKYYNKSESTNDFKNISGSFAYFNESSPDTYQTALLGNESLRWIESKLAQNEPFYGYIGTYFVCHCVCCTINVSYNITIAHVCDIRVFYFFFCCCCCFKYYRCTLST